MIYIVEIPHQRKPFCWTAHDAADAVEKIIMVNIKMGNTPADMFAQAKDQLEKAHRRYIFTDAAAAIDGLKEICGHGAVEAIAALRKELEATGCPTGMTR